MLELYHHGSSVCAAKVRLALAEKELAWTGRYVDILRGEQFDPEYLRRNPKGVVPTLVHDGETVVESTVICEYLEDAFAARPLRPSRAVDRATMRLWTKAVDEELHPACGELTIASCHRHIWLRMPQAELVAFLERRASNETVQRQRRKKELVTLGFAAPGIDTRIACYARCIRKLDEQLRNGPWLAGPEFSLAEVALAPYVNRLHMLGMSGFWEQRPRVGEWFERVSARASFKAAVLDWIPEPLTNDLATFGTQNWPAVRSILERVQESA